MGINGRTTPRGARPADPLVSVVVPALNEARNLEVVLPALPPVHEVIVVDGGSVDDTVPTVRRVCPAARIIQQTRTGKGNALACGLAEVTGDIVVTFDADGSADPEEIEHFVAALVGGADFAKGSRYRAGGGSDDITRLRSWGNRSLNWHANRLFGTEFTDLCYGYNAFWADVIPVLDLPDPDLESRCADQMYWGDGFEIETMINCRVSAGNLRVAEIPSYELDRIHGVSNLSAVSDGMRVLRTMWIERSRARKGRAVTMTDRTERTDRTKPAHPSRGAGLTQIPRQRQHESVKTAPARS